MKTRKIAQYNLFLFLILFCVQSITAQENRFDLFLKGGINIPSMDDINNIYQKDLVGYDDVTYAFDLSSGFALNIKSNFSLKLGFNYLLHAQSPPTELIEADGDTVDANIKYRIKGYNPFLGFSYNNSFNSTYKYSLGANLVYSSASLSDDLDEADTFFEYLKGNGLGYVFEASVRRSISEKLDVGLELGYRILNIKKLKINSKKYPDQTEDINFNINGGTIDLDFSGPLVRLMVVYKI